MAKVYGYRETFGNECKGKDSCRGYRIPREFLNPHSPLPDSSEVPILVRVPRAGIFIGKMLHGLWEKCLRWSMPEVWGQGRLGGTVE